MIITEITAQQKSPNRVNVFVDGVYRFSLDIFQLSDLGIRKGKEYSEEELQNLEVESQFGKLYARTLEYCLLRPHSGKEVKDYLWRKTRDTKTKDGTTRPGVSRHVADRVYERLCDKGYVNDEAFVKYWLENRHVLKGASRRKLVNELRAKGVATLLIENALSNTGRSDMSELQKVLAKKQARYPDRQKLLQYLMRQGFAYDDVRQAIDESNAA